MRKRGRVLAARWILVERGEGEEEGDGEGDGGGDRIVWRIEVVRIRRSEVGEGAQVGIVRRGGVSSFLGDDCIGVRGERDLKRCKQSCRGGFGYLLAW